MRLVGWMEISNGRSYEEEEEEEEEENGTYEVIPG